MRIRTASTPNLERYQGIEPLSARLGRPAHEPVMCTSILAESVGIEPTQPGSQVISVFKTGALPLCQLSVNLVQGAGLDTCTISGIYRCVSIAPSSHVAEGVGIEPTGSLTTTTV